MRNGALPQSALRPIGGGYFLAPGAAAAFLAMSAEARLKYGTNIYVHAAYRSYAVQVYFWRLYQSGRGNLAAFPGTSNHGWGLAIDLASRRMREIVDQIGAKYGWSKRWSDAPSEWWHIRWRAGIWESDPVLRFGDHGRAVRRLQSELRARGFKSVAVTGSFGRATLSAVKRFQAAHHLAHDGVVGPSTWKALL